MFLRKRPFISTSVSQASMPRDGEGGGGGVLMELRCEGILSYNSDSQARMAKSSDHKTSLNKLKLDPKSPIAENITSKVISFFLSI